MRRVASRDRDAEQGPARGGSRVMSRKGRRPACPRGGGGGDHVRAPIPLSSTMASSGAVTAFRAMNVTGHMGSTYHLREIIFSVTEGRREAQFGARVCTARA